MTIQQPDDMRHVDLSDDGLSVLPDHATDDGDARLLEDRPPHWD